MKERMEARKKKMKGNDLPLCLIETEILTRLPAKSLGRCMCVSKQWKSFISTPTFARMHLRTVNDYNLLQSDGQHVRTLPLTERSIAISHIPSPFNDPIILASLDGLVCLASREVHTNLAFWNPLTGAYKKLSKNSFCFPFICRNAAGFYKDSTNDYKLVYLGDFWAYIYSHRLETWREIDFPLGPRPSECTWSPATLWGQYLYFNVKTYYMSTSTVHWSIICFDVETETFRDIGFPPVPDGEGFVNGGCLIILNGHIHLYVSYETKVKGKWWKHGDLWRMDGDDGWVKVVAFKDSYPLNRLSSTLDICTASTGNWLAVLDRENNSLKKVSTQDFITQYPYDFCLPWKYTHGRLIIYVETLVSPNSSE